jgi:hypothetical protein
MKKVTFFVLFLALYSITYAQTFRNAFDRSIGVDYGQGYSFEINLNGQLQTFETQFLTGFLDMYKATKDKKYLDKFIIHCKRIIERRDDNVHNGIPIPNGTSCSNLSALPPVCYNHEQVSCVTNIGWSYDEGCTWTPEIMGDGALCEPMAEFIYLILVEEPNNTDLVNTVVPEETRGYYPYINLSINIQTYADFATWLRIKVNETLQYLNLFWNDSNNEHCYHNSTRGHVNTGDSHKLATNIQAAIGKALIYGYLMEQGLGNTAYADEYQSKITDIATLIESELIMDATDPNNPNDPNAYFWYHTFEHYPEPKWLIEDGGHGAIVTDFADLCHRYVTDFNNGTPLFYYSDMVKFSNMFTDHLYISPMQYAVGINGVDFPTAISNDATSCPGVNDCIGLGYADLGIYNKYVYHIIADYYCENATGSSYVNLGEVSKLYKSYIENHQLFDYVAVKRGPLLSKSCITNGDLNGDGMQDFITGSTNGTIHIYNISNGNQINEQAHSTNNFSFDKMTAANMDGSAGDEIIVCNNGTIQLLKWNGSNSLNTDMNNPIASYTGWSGQNMGGISTINLDNIGNEEIVIANNSDGKIYILNYNSSFSLISLANNFVSYQIVGITVGDFDPLNNGKEIAIAENATGTIKVYAIINSSLSLLHQYNTNTGPSNMWNGITSGDFDGDGEKEIVAFRTNDGQFLILKIKNNQLISEYGEYFPTNTLHGVMCNYSITGNSAIDHLVTIRHSDGQITVFNMDGLCPSLKLNNYTINADATIDNIYTQTQNNFNYDYHSNNRLTAGNNFIIESPSIVTFTAGNEISLTNGFSSELGSNLHAYIDPGLLCTHMSFKNHQTQPTHTDMGHQNHSNKKNYTTLSVFPNPNPGNFTVAAQTQLSANSNLYILDLSGRILHTQTITVQEGLTQIPISTTELPAGIYFIRIDGLDGTAKVVITK